MEANNIVMMKNAKADEMLQKLMPSAEALKKSQEAFNEFLEVLDKLLTLHGVLCKLISIVSLDGKTKENQELKKIIDCLSLKIRDAKEMIVFFFVEITRVVKSLENQRSVARIFFKAKKPLVIKNLKDCSKIQDLITILNKMISYEILETAQC